jgi:hypothetical protein
MLLYATIVSQVRPRLVFIWIFWSRNIHGKSATENYILWWKEKLMNTALVFVETYFSGQDRCLIGSSFIPKNTSLTVKINNNNPKSQFQ